MLAEVATSCGGFGLGSILSRKSVWGKVFGVCRVCVSAGGLSSLKFPRGQSQNVVGSQIRLLLGRRLRLVCKVVVVGLSV